MAADGKNFKLYRYVDNLGNNHSLRVDTTVGDDADYGFAAYNAADPLWVRTPRNYPRTVTLMDPVTHRTVTRPVGTEAAAAWLPAAFASDIFFPGKADPVEYVRVRSREERRANKNQIVNNLPEPAADAP